jgi:hypothetical protein
VFSNNFLRCATENNAGEMIAEELAAPPELALLFCVVTGTE